MLKVILFSKREPVRRFLIFVMVFPAFENSPSLGTDVATIVKDIFNCLCNLGKTVFLSSQSSKGFDRYEDNSSFVNERFFLF